MKLSEAIRLGAMLKPQAHREFLTTEGASCALGAALDAVGGLSSISSFHDIAARWPWTRGKAVRCPSCAAGAAAIHTSPDDILDNVVILNDVHGWTREQVADWVETIEARLEQPATEHQEVVA